jgi:hypothetical protein
MASVMTTSSGFWEVLFGAVCQPNRNVSHVIESSLGKVVGRGLGVHTYICSRGVLPGVMWESTLERRWVAIVRELWICEMYVGGKMLAGRAAVGIDTGRAEVNSANL